MKYPIRLEYPKPQILQGAERKVVGISGNMSIAKYEVKALWEAFMPRRKEVRNTISEELLSLTIYPEDYFASFDPDKTFEKWAGAEVSSFPNLPSMMQAVVIPAGLYAVFQAKGLSSDNAIYRYIFQQWLPESGYEIDQRPHFEVLGEQYRQDDPEAQEMIWIPIRKAGL